MTDQRDCAHQWQSRSGCPLACIKCGLLWPDVDYEWPPEPQIQIAARGDYVPWGRRVDRVVDELRRIA